MALLGVGSHVPERRLTNEDLSKFLDTSDEWIRTRTGIRERRVCTSGERASDLAAAAAFRALRDASVRAEELDAIVLATSTPDQPVPSTAAFVQAKIGAVRAMGFDLSAGCTGFVYALQVGRSLIASGLYRNALVIGVDVLTSVTDYKARETSVLFGDGAGALVLGGGDGIAEIVDVHLGLDGKTADFITVSAGGSANPASADTVERREHYLRMKGRDVFRFAVDALASTTRALLESNGLDLDDLGLLVPHQANQRIVEAAVAQLGVGMERVMSNIDRLGNTGAASLPLALDEALRTGRVRDGAHVVLAGFGAGSTWGGALLRFHPLEAR